jgi:hypothetical protein
MVVKKVKKFNRALPFPEWFWRNRQDKRIECYPNSRKAAMCSSFHCPAMYWRVQDTRIGFIAHIA